MNITLATSPHVRHAAVLQRDFKPDPSLMYSFAPVGLLSLVATLRRDRPDIRCNLYDLNRKILSGAFPLNGNFYRSVAEDLCSASPDVLGFMTECDSYHHILQIAEAIKKRDSKCRVLLGGPHASAVARQTIERCAAIDAVVIGEGEATLTDLLGGWQAEEERCIAGAAVRSRQGEILFGQPRDLIHNLDDLPIPAYDLYHPDHGEEMFLEVGRGCPFKCDFCSTAPFWGRRHRVKSPQRIILEIALLRDLFKTERTHFTHDLFTTDRAWVQRVCEALIQADVPIRWTCSARTDTVDESLLELMYRAGCNAIYFGLESGSERILRDIRKSIPLPHSLSILKACKEIGITPNAGFIAGFPTEDEQSLRETLDAYERALRIGCRPTHLFGYCPFAKSSMYSTLRGLVCHGHFIDLPLGTVTDLNNRNRIANDVDLYGSYFRLQLNLIPGEKDAVETIDEFSPLVEAALVPSLALSDLAGGMFEVFRLWLSWIHSFNDKRRAADYRRGYGTPAIFARFLVEELSRLEAGTKILELARAVQINLEVAETVRPVPITTMASHRSLPLPAIEKISLGTKLSAGTVVATFASDYDITPALLGQADSDPGRELTYLIWQATSDESVRLLRVDEQVYQAIMSLVASPGTPAELLMRNLPSTPQEESDSPPDVFALLGVLEVAEREGLVVRRTE